jgi:hypothetical protein
MFLQLDFRSRTPRYSLLLPFLQPYFVSHSSRYLLVLTRARICWIGSFSSAQDNFNRLQSKPNEHAELSASKNQYQMQAVHNICPISWSVSHYVWQQTTYKSSLTQTSTQVWKLISILWVKLNCVKCLEKVRNSNSNVQMPYFISPYFKVISSGFYQSSSYAVAAFFSELLGPS